MTGLHRALQNPGGLRLPSWTTKLREEMLLFCIKNIALQSRAGEVSYFLLTGSSLVSSQSILDEFNYSCANESRISADLFIYNTFKYK